jgi:thiol-disulfide isomerase/thioredoxin
MKKYNVYMPALCLLLLTLGAVSCQKKHKDIHQSNNGKAVSQGKCVLPQVPLIITKRSEQMNYLADHYWDNFNFRDTVNIADVSVEEHFNDYLGILTRVPSSISRCAVNGLMEKSDWNSKVLMRFFSLSEKYLYDPNSPLRNETLYIEFLKHLLENKILPDVYKIRPRHQYEMARRNAPGSKASNFEFRTAAGGKGLLHKIKSPYLLIYFNNPDCGDCKRVCSLLQRSSAIYSGISSGKLKILSVYPDEDLAVWKKENSAIPSSWINAYNPGGIVKKNEIYDLKAIPCLYLLDHNKRVLLKDAVFEEVEHFLMIKE